MELPKIGTAFSVGPIYREFLYKIAMLNIHQNVLEIGCMVGYSTSAFITALNNDADFNLSLCDTHFQPSVRHLAAKCVKPINLMQSASRNVINSKYDLIFVDGDHTIATVREEIELLLASKTKTIVIHDTHLIEEVRFWGPVLAKAVFDVHPAYYGFTLHNSEEHFLSLGLSVYSRDEDVYQILYELAVENAQNRKLTYKIYPSNSDKHAWRHQHRFVHASPSFVKKVKLL